MSWLLVVCFLTLGAATGWWITRTFILPRPPAFPHDWDTMTPDQRRTWLRHPSHSDRCSCRTYGLLADTLMVLDNDNSGEVWSHTAEQCQPMREAL